MPAVRVALEAGSKRVFAIALAWPGWARSGKGAEDALAALAAYAPRYARIVRSSRHPLPDGDLTYDVVERLRGGSGTDFGVPSATARGEDLELDKPELARQVALLRAAWAGFDRAARAAEGVELTKGPRGGGRDLRKMIGHVLEADEAYVGQLGSRPPRGAGRDVAARLEAVRALALSALQARARGEPLPDPRATKRPWSPRYYVRRAAWHSLDHAWELEDRSAGQH